MIEAGVLMAIGVVLARVGLLPLQQALERRSARRRQQLIDDLARDILRRMGHGPDRRP